MIKVSIVGGTGYTAGELLRLLAHHPYVEIESVVSTSSAGKPISSIHRDLIGEIDKNFTDSVNNPDVLFLCLGHGLSKLYLEQNKQSSHTQIVDLGNDFRVNDKYMNDKFIYGLTELNKNKIKEAKYIANPGCFATAIILSLLPLTELNELNNDVHIHAITGSTGAGKGLSTTSHFSYRDSNISVYKSFNHQHLDEINLALSLNNKIKVPAIHFVPMRGDFTRGIFASIYMKLDSNISEYDIRQVYEDYYKDSPFVFLSDKEINLKEVINTNKCLLNVSIRKNFIHITTALDNLLKGAAGQALQNMNLMSGFGETTGLRLKGSAF